ncbi:MAG: hypothetical protein WCO28_12715 [Bacteroidota bacterium]
MKKILTVLICASMIISAYLLSCQKASLPPAGTSAVSKPKNVFGKAGGTPCPYIAGYINSYCPDPCVKQGLMAGNDNATYTMTWTGCSSTDGTATQCLNGITYFQSLVHFYYGQPNPASSGDSCVILMEIDTVPACVQCDATHANFPFCVKLHATCTSTNNTDWVVTLDDNDPNTPPLVKYSYRAVREDITFQICCDKPGIGGIIYTYCCSGTMVRNP